MKLIIRLIVSTLAIFFASYLLNNHGVMLQNFKVAILVAVIFAISKAFLRPLLVLITLPISLITLGLFLFVINGILVLVTDYFIAGFSVSSIWVAILFSIIVSIIESVLFYVIEKAS